MIPEKIHYVWLGGKPLTELGQECLKSWKKFCPYYEIIRWDESNFNIEQNLYCKQAYEAKKYAFVSDYIRLYVMVNYGGIYMDTDVEVLKPLDNFLHHKAFSGFESPSGIPTGIMACEKDFPLFKELLEDYEHRDFIKESGEYNTVTNVVYITDKCLEKGLQLNNTLQEVDGFILYPKDYFCPKDPCTRQVILTNHSVCIHHFEGSWLTKKERQGVYLADLIFSYKNKFGKIWKFFFSVVHPIESLQLFFRKIGKRGKSQ